MSVLLKISLKNNVNSYSGLIFKPILGKYDLIGNYLNSINLSNLFYSYNFLIKGSLYVFFYLFILSLLSFFILFLVDKIKSLNLTKNKDSDLIIKDKKEDKQSKMLTFIHFYFNFLMLSIYIVLTIYSSLRIRNEIFYFNSFKNSYLVGYSIIFSSLFLIISIFYVVSISLHYKRKDFNISNIVDKIKNIDIVYIFQVLILPLFSFIFFFGITVFPHISFSIGGGEPRPVKINMINPEKNIILGNTFLIGENNQFFFIVSVENKEIGKAFELNKNLVLSIETKNTTPK